LWRAIYP